MKAKKVLAGLLGMALMTTVVGCGSTETDSAENLKSSDGQVNVSSQSKEDAVNLTFNIWDQNQAKCMKDIAAEFTASHPNITVDVQITPWDEYWTKLEAAAMGGTMPDIFWMHTKDIIKYAENGVLMDVGNIFEGTEDSYENFPAGLIDSFTVDEKILAIPKDIGISALVYNKELFDKAGVSYPDSTWDWNTYLEAAKKITDAEAGVWGCAAWYTEEEGTYPLILQNGGTIINEDGTSGYTNPKTIEALKFYTDLSLVHKVSPTQQQFAETSEMAMFQSGKIGMMTLGSWNINTMNSSEDITGKFDIAELPMGLNGDRGVIYNGLAYGAAASTKHPEEVKTFLQYLGGEEANKIQGASGTVIPAYTGTGDLWVQYYGQYHVENYIKGLEYSTVILPTKSTPRWRTAEKDYMLQAMAGNISVEEAAAAIADEMNELLSKDKN